MTSICVYGKLPLMKPKLYFHRAQQIKESFMIYLPRKWCEILNLEKGDVLKITDHKNGKLTIEKAR